MHSGKGNCIGYGNTFFISCNVLWAHFEENPRNVDINNHLHPFTLLLTDIFKMFDTVWKLSNQFIWILYPTRCQFYYFFSLDWCLIDVCFTFQFSVLICYLHVQKNFCWLHILSFWHWIEPFPTKLNPGSHS